MNSVLDKINEILTISTLQDATRSQLENHREMYKRSEQYLSSKEHKIAFIGNVGAGKTTSICHLLGLVDNGNPVLSTGSGRTTLCEVHIKNAPEAKVEVIPYSEDELKSFLNDFALFLKSDDSDREQEGFKLSAEIERALRNMLNLKIDRKRIDGKRIATDNAKLYANEFDSVDGLYEELVKRIDIPSRTQTSFINNDDQDEMSWLHETFKLLNSATHKNVSLAKRITLFVPNLDDGDHGFSVTFVDTKGVDQTVNRTDLDSCLTSDKTISVFCSRFNDAPDQTCSKMIDSVIKAGLKSRLNEEALLLVLDRAGEAEDVMDYDEAAGDKEDGRDIKAEQIKGELSQRYAVRDLAVEFFDAKQDASDEILSLLVEKIVSLRTQHGMFQRDIYEAVIEIEHEIKSQSSLVAMQQVTNTLKPWLKKSMACSPALSEFFVPLVSTIRSKGTYAASVRASVNRDGDWHNLDYYQELAVAARGQCVFKIGPLKDELITLIDNMLLQPDLKLAFSLLKQLKHTTEVRLDAISQLALAKGRSVYESQIKADDDFWKKNYNEWGKGSGYKNRISDHTNEWFKKNDYSGFEFEVSRKLVEQWESYINEIEQLIAPRLQ